MNRAALALALLAACAPSPPREVRGGTMGTTYTVKYADDVAVERVHEIAERTLQDVNARFSTYAPDSEISRFNAHASSEPFAASPEFVALLRQALEVARKSDGAFDPTVAPVVDLEGFGADGREPHADAGAMAAARRHVGYARLEVIDDRHLRKADPELTIDLSAIAKGYGVDQVCRALVPAQVANFMVEVGGEVRCAGRKADGSAWVIGIERPAHPGEAPTDVVEKVELRDRALATSGSYRNFRRTGGKEIHHIFDPHTGRNPDNGVVSASVLASTCALADALATTLMVVGPERAEAVLAQFDDPLLAALLISSRDGEELAMTRVRWRP